jgi:hypothetical protein
VPRERHDRRDDGEQQDHDVGQRPGEQPGAEEQRRPPGVEHELHRVDGRRRSHPGRPARRHTSRPETAMPAYSTVHTGPNSDGGGAQEGFWSAW